MPYILDDTEVNTSVYDKLLRPARRHKPKRTVATARVRFLEANLRLLQEQLLKFPVQDIHTVEVVTNFSLPKQVNPKAKPRSRRQALDVK